LTTFSAFSLCLGELPNLPTRSSNDSFRSDDQHLT
jgi:hypothetical protein